MERQVSVERWVSDTHLEIKKIAIMVFYEIWGQTFRFHL